MGIVDRWRRFVGADQERYSFADWLEQMSFNGTTYPLYGGSLYGNEEKIGGGFEAYVNGAYKSNGVVFACMLARLMLFSEARFAWRDLSSGRPGDITVPKDGRNPASGELDLLMHPWYGGTTGDLLARMIQDADLAGNAFVWRNGRELQRLRPDWVSIAYDGNPWDLGTSVSGYLYQEGGPQKGKDPVFKGRDSVAHFAPNPDPTSPWRGMSWLTPVIREIQADSAATAHKGSLFQHGATPNMVVKADTTVTKEIFDAQVKNYRESHEGASNAGKAWFLSAGWDPVVLGANLQQLDFKATQGAGETRIAAASGIHPVVVGLSEGMQGSALNAGNFNSARRLTADKTLRPLWRNVCGTLPQIVREPIGKELWYLEKDIAFLQEDQKDAAEIQQIQASTIKQLVDAGYEQQSVQAAVIAGDWSLLKHTGLFSVQLQPPGTTAPEPVPNQLPNGKVPADMPMGG